MFIEDLIRSESLVPDQDISSSKEPNETKPYDINDPVKKVKDMDKNKIFMEFKEREGKSYNDAILKNMVRWSLVRVHSIHSSLGWSEK
mgnify:CR=1 FL=1